MHMRKVTVSRMRERYAQTVIIFRITYVHSVNLAWQRENISFRKFVVRQDIPVMY